MAQGTVNFAVGRGVEEQERSSASAVSCPHTTQHEQGVEFRDRAAQTHDGVQAAHRGRLARRHVHGRCARPLTKCPRSRLILLRPHLRVRLLHLGGAHIRPQGYPIRTLPARVPRVCSRSVQEGGIFVAKLTFVRAPSRRDDSTLIATPAVRLPALAVQDEVRAADPAPKRFARTRIAQQRG